MTLEELTTTFEQHKKGLSNYVRRRYKVYQDREDLLSETYLSALGGEEYTKVPLERARSWWYYKVSRKAHDYVNKAVGDLQGMQRYHADPTAHNEYHEDLHESDAMEVLEEHWKGLTRYTQTRMRQQWRKEGRQWYPFMYPKT